jgi:hypothetical protein
LDPNMSLTQQNSIVQFVVFISVSFFLISSMRNVWLVLFLRESNVIWLSVYTVAALSFRLYVFCVFQCS